MAAHSEAEANSLLVYKSPAWKGGVLYSSSFEGRFSRMFRSLPAAEWPKPALATLSIKMTADPKRDKKDPTLPSASFEDPKKRIQVDEENAGIPAGYTYLGQFITTSPSTLPPVCNSRTTPMLWWISGHHGSTLIRFTGVDRATSLICTPETSSGWAVSYSRAPIERMFATCLDSRTPTSQAARSEV